MQLEAVATTFQQLTKPHRDVSRKVNLVKTVKYRTKTFSTCLKNDIFLIYLSEGREKRIKIITQALGGKPDTQSK